MSQPYPDPQPRELGLSLELVARVPDSRYGPARPNAIVPYRDGSGAAVVTDLKGVAYRLSPDGTLTSLLDARALVPTLTDGKEQGLQAAVPHPKRPGLLLTVTTESANPDTEARFFALPMEQGLPIEHYDVVCEWDPVTGRRQVLLVIAKPRTDHNANEPLCLPDASCLIPVGDGGNTAATGTVGANGFGQRLDSPLGTLLRITPNGDGTYAIPADNPFAQDDNPGTLAEIFAYGFRNPQRGYRAADGTLYWIDMGQAIVEELNRVVRGGNYGWPLREGQYCVIARDEKVLATCRPLRGFTDPIAAYGHGQGLIDRLPRLAVSGVAVCTGCGIPDLEGAVLVVDLNSGALLHPLADGNFEELRLNGKTLAQSLGSGRVETRLAVDANGSLLILSRTDRNIYRIRQSDAPPLTVGGGAPLIGLLLCAGGLLLGGLLLLRAHRRRSRGRRGQDAMGPSWNQPKPDPQRRPDR
ncbi:PQQ-dependent sugar dehydrogenase [uncultured Thiodictyon sp.]|uniref:PQQ-dependent sugar dehydrogenase n=1 Tax=uncultured Thiodictyon sp. TaxID=1846217 RepID=UPI0025D99276|nr:PQQ-dependent sugar dehydrogenase [uncultured Thiodictyon sp.]